MVVENKHAPYFEIFVDEKFSEWKCQASACRSNETADTTLDRD